MPTYVYRREDGTTFEVFQRISEEPLTEDSETGQKVTRVISGGTGLQFKGSGFYVTDYVRSGASPSPSGETKAESKAKTKSEPKSDSSPVESTSPSSDSAE